MGGATGCPQVVLVNRVRPSLTLERRRLSWKRGRGEPHWKVLAVKVFFHVYTQISPYMCVCVIITIDCVIWCLSPLEEILNCSQFVFKDQLEVYEWPKIKLSNKKIQELFSAFPSLFFYNHLICMNRGAGTWVIMLSRTLSEVTGAIMPRILPFFYLTNNIALLSTYDEI